MEFYLWEVIAIPGHLHCCKFRCLFAFLAELPVITTELGHSFPPWNIHLKCFFNKITNFLTSAQLNEFIKFFHHISTVVLRTHNLRYKLFLLDYTKEDLSYLLDLLDMNDVQMIYKKFKCKKANSKEERINNLLKYCNSQSTLISSSSIRDLLLTEIKQKMGNCIRLKKTFQDSFYNIFLLATFTNSAFSNINDYFANIIGLKICLPTYIVEEYKMFHSRNEFIR